MRQISLLFWIFTFCSSVQALPKMPHDPTACPDLTGTFRMKNGAYTKLVLISTVDASGTNILIKDAESRPEEVRLDGKAYSTGLGEKFNVCNGQAVYEHYTYPGRDPYLTVMWLLDEDRNLIWSYIEERKNTKIKGIRQ